VRLVISNASHAWGGAEAMAETLARGLQQRGHDILVFCRRDGSPLQERLAGDVPCEPILGGFDLHPVTLWRCGRALRRHRAEAVITNAVKDPRWTGVAARMLGIPVVFRQETDQPYKDVLRHRLFYGWVPDCHLVNSEATRRTLLASVDWVPPERVVVIPNGVDVSPLLAAAPADLGLPDGALAIGFVGRFEARKGIWELARAWPQVARTVPEAHLVIAGWGPEEAEFRQALHGAPRVHWLGFRKDVPQLMKAFDILAVPSHYEGFGLVVVEAMAAGTPVVATSASSIPEILTDGAEGRLVPPRDPAALTRALIELASDPELRNTLGGAGRERARVSFAVSEMLERHEALLQELVKRK
jgi:glycosyltransferase involved in cell wall biosynthesis